MILPYKPAKDKRIRQKIGQLRDRKFRVNLWHYGRHYVRGWYEKVKNIFGTRDK